MEKNKHILYFENEEQAGLKEACQAYRNGVRYFYFSKSKNNEPFVRDVRIFIFNRVLLIIYNLTCNFIWGILNRVSQYINVTIKNNVYKIQPAFIKHVVIRYFEYRYSSILDRFVDKFKTPLLDNKSYTHGRVQLFISSLGPGGAERQFVNATLGLAEKWDVVVSCGSYINEAGNHFGSLLESHGKMINHMESIDAALHALKAIGSQEVNSLLEDDFFNEDNSFGRSLIPYIREIIKHRPAVVHAWLDYVNVRAGLAAMIVGVPKIILSQRSAAPIHFRFFTIEMRPVYKVLLQSDRVIMLNNSQYGAFDYSKWLNIKLDGIKVIYNGVSFLDNSFGDTVARGFRSKYHIPQDVPLVGSIMRFSEEKRPFFWLRHAKEVLKLCPSAYFLLIGSGDMLEEAMALSRKLHIDDRMIFTGLIEQSSTAPAIKAMDAFILTSKIEGLPNVLIEAQDLGVPVITTDAGGAKETVKDGVTGYVVKNPTPRKVASIVNKVLKDKTWRERAKVEGPKFVRARFSFEKMICDLHAVYMLENKSISR